MAQRDVPEVRGYYETLKFVYKNYPQATAYLREHYPVSACPALTVFRH
jgi:hypothetical protein